MLIPSRVRGAIANAGLRIAQRAGGVRYAPVDDGALSFPVYRRPSTPRWGWGRPRHAALETAFASRHDAFMSELDFIPSYGTELAAIDREHRTDLEPCWKNPLFIGLDGASLYAYLRQRHPRRFLEVGSGYSTRFAARAKRDGELSTEIISIDPEPRVDIDQICDRVIRAPLETVDQRVFDELEPNDVLFFDGSHRVLMDSDVTVFFLELLPRLPAGLLVGIHDIFLPDDYSPDQLEEYWTEHYMLAMALLAGNLLEPVLPCHYVATTSPMTERLNALWGQIGLEGTNAWGSVFWGKVTAAEQRPDATA